MKKIPLIILIVLPFVFASHLLSAQQNSNKTIVKTYIDEFDYSSYMQLVLFEDGSFDFESKFEASGISQLSGSWHKNKRRIKLYNISKSRFKNVLFPGKKWWYCGEDKICSTRKCKVQSCMFLAPPLK